MQIDRNLNLVMPVDLDDGKTVYVHSVPVQREVFEKYYRVMSRTFANLMRDGSILSGPRTALLELRAVAGELGTLEGEGGVEMGLIAEMRRLSNLVLPAPEGGWTTLPLEHVIGRQMLSADDVSEVENRIAFFTLQSRLLLRRELVASVTQMARLWDAQIVSSTCTEYARSLPTLTVAVSSGETVASSASTLPG